MARMTEDGMSASVGPKVKQRTVRCPHCSIELNLPESALGRRLKCPKCEAKFTAPALQDLAVAEEGSSLYLPTRGVGSSGSVELPSFGGSSGSVELPTSLAPLRETFDLPLLSDAEPPSRSRNANAPSADAGAADALGLFKDEPKSTRKPRGAEARAQARRCSSCSTIVPAGMSLCAKCGLDLDTGQHHTPIDLYDEAVPMVHRNATPPIGVLLLGSLCSFGFFLLSLISLVHWTAGVRGAEFLLVIWLFGIFGGVQFLRRKSIRPMLLSLSLAVAVGSIYLIALPIYYANMPPGSAPTELDPIKAIEENLEGQTDGPQIKSIADNLDLNSITWGVGSLLSYAAVAVYLNSPGLRRHFKR